MNITASAFDQFLITDKLPQPPDEVNSKEIERINRFFYEKKGFRETDLSKRMISLIARNKVGLSHDGEYCQMKKGAAIFGNVGTGKTLMLKLAAFIFDADYHDVPSLSVEFSRHGAKGFWELVETRNSRRDFILDDLGAEQDAKNFGNSVPIADLIYSRYDMWQRSGARLWVSSNLKTKDISKYGDRVVDRLKEMCEGIPVTSDSLRLTDKNHDSKPTH